MKINAKCSKLFQHGILAVWSETEEYDLEIFSKTNFY